VNLLGAAFLGWVNGAAQGPKPRFVTPASKWFWGAGFAGGFTTMSGLALGFVLLSTQTGATIGVVYLLAQLFFGLVTYGSGYYAGKKVWPGE
jgi:fluoride ion exporter CrcB/FEX